MKKTALEEELLSQAETWSNQNAEMPLRQATHVIFDMDGLLLDTEYIYNQIMQEIAEMYDKPYSSDIHVKVMGTTELYTAETAIKDLNLPISTSEYLDIYRTKAIEKMAEAKLMEGADLLVRHLYANRIPIAVATGSGEQLYNIKTKNHKELFSLFDHVVSSSSDREIKRGKPSPDIYLVTAYRFPDKPNPNRCLVFEDAPNGVHAAIAAGMQCVMVPDVNCPLNKRKLASSVVRSLEDIHLEEFNLPPLEPKFS